MFRNSPIKISNKYDNIIQSNTWLRQYYLLELHKFRSGVREKFPQRTLKSKWKIKIVNLP